MVLTLTITATRAITKIVVPTVMLNERKYAHNSMECGLILHSIPAAL